MYARFLLFCALALVAGPSFCQAPSPPPGSPLDTSMQQYQQWVAFAPNPGTSSAPLDRDHPGIVWTPSTGYEDMPGILSTKLANGGPLRVDTSLFSFPLGDGFKAGWVFTSRYSLPIFTVIIGFVVGLNAVKRYAKKWGG